MEIGELETCRVLVSLLDCGGGGHLDGALSGEQSTYVQP
jgi:hypothetical protein